MFATLSCNYPFDANKPAKFNPWQACFSQLYQTFCQSADSFNKILRFLFSTIGTHEEDDTRAGFLDQVDKRTIGVEIYIHGLFARTISGRIQP